MSGIYPVVELGPSFSNYASTNQAQLGEILGGLEAIYNLVDDIRVNFLAPMSNAVETTSAILEANSNGSLNAFYTIPVAP